MKGNLIALCALLAVAILAYARTPAEKFVPFVVHASPTYFSYGQGVYGKTVYGNAGQGGASPLPMEDDDQDGILNSNDLCPGTPPGDNVNRAGCTLPRYEKFKGPLTTSFENIGLLRVLDVSLGIAGLGKIEFRANILRIVGLDLDSSIEIRTNQISLDSQNLPELNKSAVLTFFNVALVRPQILRDGKLCTECRQVSYRDGEFIFSVPSFSSYSLNENPCGDAICMAPESCSTCAADCGSCLPTPQGEGRGRDCVDFWECGEFGECGPLGLKSRTCQDTNGCGTGLNKPREVEECDINPEVEEVRQGQRAEGEPSEGPPVESEEVAGPSQWPKTAFSLAFKLFTYLIWLVIALIIVFLARWGIRHYLKRRPPKEEEGAEMEIPKYF